MFSAFATQGYNLHKITLHKIPLADLAQHCYPYLTLPYVEDVLLPSAEASNGPNVHPRINCKVTKSPTHLGPYQHLEPSPPK